MHVFVSKVNVEFNGYIRYSKKYNFIDDFMRDLYNMLKDFLKTSFSNPQALPNEPISLIFLKRLF